MDWIREVVVIHAGYLVSQGEEIKEVLERLKGTLQRRGQSWERLVRLKGRLELLKAVKGPEVTKGGREPEARWVEDGGGEEEDKEIEDVRYLTGGDEAASVEDNEDNEVEDGEMENGVASEDDNDDDKEEGDEEEEGDDDDESSHEPVKPNKKVNGIPHFSDSEDSAVDLEDLIDDEASEALDDVSEEEDDEDDDYDEEKEDEEEDEEEILPPKKKPKSER